MMWSMEKVKEKVKECVEASMQEPVKAAVVILGAALIIARVIPSRCNHHVYLHVLNK